MNILQVNSADLGSGADRVAWNLFRAYRTRGHRSSLMVGYRQSEDPDTLLLNNGQFSNQRLRIGRVINRLKRTIDFYLGHEDFNSPVTWKLLELVPNRPDVIHCHTLQGGYFDLRALVPISRTIPIVFTLHDAWLFTGHCAHSFECERWKRGCGACPHLTIYPSLRRDATAFNWQRKRDIFLKSRFYISTPCQWLMQKVKESMLAPAIVEKRVIPHGVDLSVFHPANREAIRAKLGIPQKSKIILFVGHWILKNPYKDYEAMHAAVARVSERLGKEQITFLVLGAEAPTQQCGRAMLRFIPYQKDPVVVSRYYQAADIYLHAAHVETFPNTVIEALACGTPVVASAVGGIPEQVKSLAAAGSGNGTRKTHAAREATGILVEPCGVEALSNALEQLLKDKALSLRLGSNAAKDAEVRFDLKRQIDSYFDWYLEILQCRR